MRWLCRMVTAGAIAAAVLSGCGNTINENELVLQFLNFDDMGITQCDQVNPDVASVDIVQGLCGMPPDQTAEPITPTSAIAHLQNNQKLDIIIDHCTVTIPGSGVGSTEGCGQQTVVGMRCSSDPTRACAVDDDCQIGGTSGICAPSVSSISVLLFDFTTKSLIVAQAAPFGKTFPVTVTFYGRDVAGETWITSAAYQARFDNFDNCNCQLATQ